jgi:hypothetical protein
LIPASERGRGKLECARSYGIAASTRVRLFRRRYPSANANSATPAALPSARPQPPLCYHKSKEAAMHDPHFLLAIVAVAVALAALIYEKSLSAVAVLILALIVAFV